MTPQQMLDTLGQARTLNLLSKEQFRALADTIDREGWRDAFEFVLLELHRYIEDRQINLLDKQEGWRNKNKVMQILSENGSKGVARCRICGVIRDVHRTILGEWQKGTWKCPRGCKNTTHTAARIETESGSTASPSESTHGTGGTAQP